MSFRETCHADSESARIWMCARFVESPNKLYQVDRVLKRVSRFVVRNLLRPITPERENVPDLRLGVSSQHAFDLFFIMANAGQVRYCIEFCCMFDALDQIVS